MACNKVKYSTEKAALFDLIRIRKKSNRKTIPTRVYRCRDCGCWHLTSSIPFDSFKNREAEKKEKERMQKELNDKDLKIKELEAKIVFLETEFKQFRNATGSEDRIKIKTDLRLAESKEHCKALENKIKVQRDAYNDLCSKYVKLQNQLKNINQ